MRRKPTIDEMQKIAKSRGGKCLSSEYINNSTQLKWKCNKGHIWRSTPNNIKRGSWCRSCSNKRLGILRRLTIEEMQEVAKKRGGECISKEYVTIATKLKWRCKEGHEWLGTPSNIKNDGSWCPECANKVKGNRKYTIEDMQKIAEDRGGNCLSKKYKYVHTKLRWQCKEGHEWEGVPSRIIHGTWCPYCAGRYVTIEEIQDVAKQRRGKCLSNEYINTSTNLKWKCGEGHEWMATPNNVKSGTWCPACAMHKRSMYGYKTKSKKNQIITPKSI